MRIGHYIAGNGNHVTGNITVTVESVRGLIKWLENRRGVNVTVILQTNVNGNNIAGETINQTK